jgi:maltooligosyltrehalose synthase
LVVALLQSVGFEHQRFDDDQLVLPENSPTRWRSVFTGERIEGNGRIELREIFKTFPVALFTSE